MYDMKIFIMYILTVWFEVSRLLSKERDIVSLLRLLEKKIANTAFFSSLRCAEPPNVFCQGKTTRRSNPNTSQEK